MELGLRMNTSPLITDEDGLLPKDVLYIPSVFFLGEVVKSDIAFFLAAIRESSCRYQIKAGMWKSRPVLRSSTLTQLSPKSASDSE